MGISNLIARGMEKVTNDNLNPSPMKCDVNDNWTRPESPWPLTTHRCVDIIMMASVRSNHNTMSGVRSDQLSFIIRGIRNYCSSALYTQRDSARQLAVARQPRGPTIRKVDIQYLLFHNLCTIDETSSSFLES